MLIDDRLVQTGPLLLILGDEVEPALISPLGVLWLVIGKLGVVFLPAGDPNFPVVFDIAVNIVSSMQLGFFTADAL